MEYRLPPSFTVLGGSKRSSQSMATYRLCEQPTLVQYSPLLSRTHFLTHTTGNYRFPISCDATLIMGPMRTAGGTFTDLTSDQEFVDEIRRRTRGRKEFEGKSIKKREKVLRWDHQRNQPLNHGHLASSGGSLPSVYSRPFTASNKNVSVPIFFG